MATKLTSSLRKSITAEKESLDNKLSTEETANKPIEPKKPVIRKSSASAKGTTFNKVQPEKVIASDVIKTSTTSEDINNSLAQSNPLPLADSVMINKEKLANESAIKAYNIANNFANSNYELGDITLQTLQAVNQDLTNYLYEIADLNNISNLQALNTELMTKLHLRQKNLFEESMKILMKISGIK